MEPVALVMLLVLIEYFYFGLEVGRARERTGIAAPAISGHPEFERFYRVQQNTLEQLAIFLPSLWLFGVYVHALLAAGLGLLFLVGRFMYFRAYVADPAGRGPGFVVGLVAQGLLVLGALGGALVAWL